MPVLEKIRRKTWEGSDMVMQPGKNFPSVD